MNSIYFVAQFITYFRKTEKQKSRTAWVQWRDIVQEVYREKYFQSKIKLIINSGTADYKKIGSFVNAELLINEFNEEEKIEILELIHLFLQLLKNEKEVIFVTKLESELNQINQIISEPDKLKIDLKVQEWLTNKAEDKFYFKIKLDGTLIIVLFDFFIRWISLWFFKNKSDHPLIGSLGFFTTSQFLIIPICVIAIAYIRDKITEKKTNFIFSQLGRTDLKIINRQSPWNYLISFMILITGILIALITLEISKDDYNFVLPTFTLLYGSYLLILISFFSKKKPSIAQIINQLDKINSNQVKTNLDHHENDEEIIELDVSLRSANDKMEAYVLEAALFGALAFSGFLQLISSNNISIESLGAFSANFYSLFEGFVNFSSDKIFVALNQLLSKDGILSLMSFLTLFCSVFFLAVIASRLRFNDLSDSIDKSLQLSKIYNDKEENLISLNGGKTNESSNLITKMIRKHLIKGNLSLEQTLPIMEFMRFFRTLGIFTFFVIIVTGGLFVSIQLSLVLAFIMFISFLFFKLKSIVQFIKNKTTQFQEFYFKIESKVFYFILISVSLCFILRSFEINENLAGGIIVLSFFIIFLHYILSLFIPEKLEDEEISDSIFVSGNRNKIVLKKFYKISLSIIFLGLMLKIMHFKGANLLFFVGTLLLAIYFVIGQKTKNNNKVLGIIYRTSFSLVILGGMFFVMHWPGAGFLRLITIICLIICLILLFIYKNQLLRTTKNITITFVILGFLLQFPFFRFAFTTLSFNVKVYKEKMEISKLRTKITEPVDLGYVNAKTKYELDSLKYYMKKNDAYLEKIGAHELNEYCWIILENQSDTTVLNHNLKWVNWIISKENHFLHHFTKIELLIKLEKYSEALLQIKLVEKMHLEGDEKANRKQLIEYRNQCLKELSKSK
jgi:hypothetical protein